MWYFIFVANLEIFEPLVPRYPDLLEEACELPDRVVVAHDICNILISRFDGCVGLTVRPPGEEDRSNSFSIAVDKPSGKATIFFSPQTDFEASLPGGVIRRLDQPSKRMLTRSGKERLLTTLRFGSIIGDFTPLQYGGLFGIESWHRLG